MMKEKMLAKLFLFIFFFFLPALYVQAENKPLRQQPVVTVLGRLALENHSGKEQLILHAKNAETYLVIGNLIEKLKSSLKETGNNNMVSVTGNKDGRNNLSCQRSYKYEYDIKGERTLKIDAKCIRYHYLEITQILSIEQSDEQIPLPKRDIGEERRLLTIRETQGAEPLITGEIYGKIKSINLKSPVKTIMITNRDKTSPLKKITLLITSNTRIARKIGEEDPMMLSPKALKPGQEITAVYLRDALKSEALFLTITKK